MAKEFRIPMDEIRDPQKITDVTERIFKEHGVDISRNEVKELIDDHDTKERVLKVKNTKYFTT